MTIRKKMMTLAFLVFITISGITALTFFDIKKLQTSFDIMINKGAVGKISTLEINRDVNYVSRLTRNIMLGSDIDKDIGKLEKMKANITSNYKKLKSTSSNQAESDIISKAEKASLAFVEDGLRFVRNLQDVEKSERYGYYKSYGQTATPLAVESRKYFGALVKLKDDNFNIVQQQMEKSIGMMKRILMVTSLVTIIFTMLMFYLITRNVLSSISKALNVAKTLAKNDLTPEITNSGSDEAGQMLEAMRQMIVTFRKAVLDISGGVSTLTVASTGLEKISDTMADGAEDNKAHAETVATAAEEMSTNLNSIAAAFEQTSTNSELVASAAEEISITINEISTRTEKAKGTTEDAVAQAGSASEKIADLRVATNEIGIVVETIKDISEQVNLLALNATIEAARAGEAGRGFTVVANEIKELAKLTADSTQTINEKISKIQSTTHDAEVEIGEISGVINLLNESIVYIANAVVQQTDATKEIAGNIAQVSMGVQEVNRNVLHGKDMANNIAVDITKVNNASTEMVGSSSQVRSNSEELTTLSSNLKELVDQFKVA